MANQVGFNITIGNLPDDYTASTLQDLIDKIASLLEINLDEEYALFKTGASSPDALTQVAWLKDGEAWYVPDGDGNWVPATIDSDYKRVYVQAADPTATETVAEQSLWVDTATDGTTIDALKVYLSSAWRTVGFTKSDLDTLKARVDSVIETASPYGLKEDVVEYNNLSDAAITTLVNQIGEKFMPVGTIYGNGTVTTNPGTLLGFGTWSPYSEGRALVGAGSGSGLTSRTIGSEIGDEDVTLTADQSGNRGIPQIAINTDGTGSGSVSVISTARYFDVNGGDLRAQGVGGGNKGAVIADAVAEADASTSHTNMQPSKVAALWIRTA